MGKPKLTLFIDIVSPFGYAAYYMLRHSPIFRPVEITYVPIFLGGLMKMCDNRAPIEIKSLDKGAWINVERLRYAEHFKIPMRKEMPAGFPPLTLHTQRALCALQLSDPDKIPSTIDALYESLWVDGNAAIGKPEGFAPVLQKVLGEALAKDVMARMGSAEAKKRLADNTDRAMNSGAFGIPWFECENAQGKKDAFWGFDHLDWVVRALGLEGTLELDKASQRAML